MLNIYEKQSFVKKAIMVSEIFFCIWYFMHVFDFISKLIKMFQDTLKCWCRKGVILLAKTVSRFKKIIIVAIINNSAKQVRNKVSDLRFKIYNHKPPQNKKFQNFRNQIKARYF